MKRVCKILLVENVVSDAEMIQMELLRTGIDFFCRQVDTSDDFRTALLYFCPDIIICEESLPQFDAFSAMKILKERGYDTPFLLTSGNLPEEEAIDYLTWGAYDCIQKRNLKRLPFAVKNALLKSDLMREKQDMELAHRQLSKHHLASAERTRSFTDSVIYAKGIQTALLPKQNYIHRYFPESFLINMPKDIVSGDFYWFSEYDGKFVVAVGDCTGHGVPAALISMIGYNKLDAIVNTAGVTNPAQILSRLNLEIREAFRDEDKRDSIHDGMDIAVCVIDPKRNVVEFAGANRPLYYVQDQTLRIIKGDKRCIGGNLEETLAKYSTHTLSVDSTDSIYMFTDGFLDQFGGDLGKKFLSKRFKELLASVQSLPMVEQKERLITTLKDWKGELEQTDDICVIGIQL